MKFIFSFIIIAGRSRGHMEIHVRALRTLPQPDEILVWYIHWVAAHEFFIEKSFKSLNIQMK